MAFYFDFGKGSRRPIGRGGEGGNFLAHAGDYFAGVAFEEYFAYKIGFDGSFSVGKVPVRVERFG